MPCAHVHFYEVEIFPGLDVHVSFRAELTFFDERNYTLDTIAIRTRGKSAFVDDAWTDLDRAHPLWVPLCDYVNSASGCRECCRAIEWEIDQAGGPQEVFRVAAE